MKVASMKSDIALAGFLLTAEEWQSFDPSARAQLIALASGRDDAWVAAPLAGVISEPTDAEAPRT
jgi:uncharacterized protein involved in response to NO